MSTFGRNILAQKFLKLKKIIYVSFNITQKWLEKKI